jgi:predicted nucleic acid-binding protein
MVICCDTSFLFSFYATDAHTSRALAELKSLSQPIALTKLNEFEFGNALRFAEYRKLLAAGKAEAHIADFNADILAGNFIDLACNLAMILDEAKKLSAKYTTQGGYRSFDILHVAASLHLGAREFLSFDANQRKLAKAEGLKIRPV